MNHDRTSGRRGLPNQPSRPATSATTANSYSSYTPSDQSLVAENLGSMSFISQERTLPAPPQGAQPDYPSALTDALRRSQRSLPRPSRPVAAHQNLYQHYNTSMPAFAPPLVMTGNSSEFSGTLAYMPLDPLLGGDSADDGAASYSPLFSQEIGDAYGFGLPLGSAAPTMSTNHTLTDAVENPSSFDSSRTGPTMRSSLQEGMFQFEAGTSASNTSAKSLKVPPSKASSKKKTSQPKKKLSQPKASASAYQQKAALIDKKAVIEAAAKAAVDIPTPAQVQTFFAHQQNGPAAGPNTISGRALTPSISAAAYVPPVQDPLETLITGARDRLTRVALEIEYRTITPPGGDDVDTIDESMLKTMAQTIYDNLAKEPRKAPEDWPQYFQDQYNVKQTRRLKTCQKVVATESAQDHLDRCILAVGDAARLHKRGVPVVDLNMKRLNAKQDPAMVTSTGIEIDTTLTCTQRIYALAVMVQVDKNVAYELLAGEPMSDNVRNPIRAIEKKLDTFYGNCVRDAHRRKGRQIELDEDAANSGPEAESDAEQPDEVDDDEAPVTKASAKRKRRAAVSPSNVAGTQAGPKAKRTKSKPASDEDVVDLE